MGRSWIAAAALLFVLSVGSVWGSGSSEHTSTGTSGKVTISFMANGNTTNQEMYQAWIKGFSKVQPDINVKYLPFPVGGWAKVRAMFAGGTVTDLFRANDDDVYDLATAGQLVQLDPYIDKYLKRKDYFAATFDELNVNGKEYSANLGFGPNVFHYNVTMAKNAGVSIPTSWDNTWTWDQFTNTLKKLTVDKNGDGRPEVYGAGWGANPSILTSFLYTNGADNPVPDGVKRANFVQPKLEAVFQSFADLATKYHYLTPVEEEQNNTPLFNSNKLAMTWATQEVSKEFNSGIKWDVAPMPKANDKAYTVMFVRCFGIPTTSKHPDAAFKFYQYAWSLAGQKIMTDYGFGVPTLRAAAAIYNQETVPAHRAIYTNALDHNAPLPKNPLGAVWKKYATHELGEQLLNGNVTAEQFLTQIQKYEEQRIQQLKQSN